MVTIVPIWHTAAAQRSLQIHMHSIRSCVKMMGLQQWCCRKLENNMELIIYLTAIAILFILAEVLQ